MVKTYRRHEKNCPHKEKGRDYWRCNCPIHVQGTLGGKKIRKSLGIRNWQQAQSLVREMEAEDSFAAEHEPVTIERACEAFLRDARARNLQEPTLGKYGQLLRHLKEFAKQNGVAFLRELDSDALRKFRETWPYHNTSAHKRLEELRAFFAFAVDNEWISKNLARKLKPPKVNRPPKLPFTRDEVDRIVEACDNYPHKFNAVRLRALVLLLRYSGLRIRDAVMLSSKQIQGDKLLVHTAKTGTSVYCPLRPNVIAALQAIPTASEYFFWTGESKPKSVVGDWQRALKKLFVLAKVPGGHAHRFRHTFAVEHLLAGVPMDGVAALLGHQSIRVTERHYAPWVRARQEQLEAYVRRAWKQLPESSGVSTQQVRSSQRFVK